MANNLLNINLQVKGNIKFDAQVIITQLMSNQNLLEFGRQAKDLIYKRTKSGYGVDNAGNKVKLKPLSPEYIEARRKKNLGEFGSAGTSNATLTGQMLKAMEVRTNLMGFEIYVNNSSRDDSGLTNAEVAEYYQATRQFLGLTTGEMKVIGQAVDKKAKEIMANINIGK